MSYEYLSEDEFDSLLLEVLLMEKKEKLSSHESYEEQRIYMYGTGKMRNQMEEFRDKIDDIEIGFINPHNRGEV